MQMVLFLWVLPLLALGSALVSPKVDYHFYEHWGQVVQDVTPSRLHAILGKLLDADSYDPDPVEGRGLWFNGVDELFVDLPPNVLMPDHELTIVNDAPIAMWLKPGFLNENTVIVSKCDPANTTGFYLGTKDTGQYRISLNLDGTQLVYPFFGTVQDRWLRIAIVISQATDMDGTIGTQVDLLIDKSEIYSFTLAGAWADSSTYSQFRVGGGTSQQFHGFIYDFELYDTAVDASVLPISEYSSPGTPCPFAPVAEKLYQSGQLCISTEPYGSSLNGFQCITMWGDESNNWSDIAGCTQLCVSWPQLTCKNDSGDLACFVEGDFECPTDAYKTTSPLTCQICHADWATCSAGSITDCLTCHANASIPIGSAHCMCATKYYMDNSVCESCPSECAECTSASLCTAWEPGTGYYLYNDECVSICPLGYFADSGTSMCKACASPCRDCDAAGAAACYDCNDLNAGLPEGYGECVCNNQYFDEDTTSGVTCVQWDSTWADCIGPSDSECTVCSDPSIHPDNTPAGKWVAGGSCPTGQYYSGVSCLDCMSNCESCNSANNCNQCSATFYFDPSSTTCTSWHPTCETCNDSSQYACTSCTDGNAEVTSTPEGECTCKTGWYDSDIDSAIVCTQCHQTCADCDSGGYQSCTVCPSGMYMIGAAPNECQCNAGTYRDIISQSCETCANPCQTCTAGNVSDCTACKDPEATPDASLGECICNSQWYDSDASLDNVVWEECDTTCATCQGPAVDDCNSCVDTSLTPQFGSVGTCVLIWSQGTFEQAGTCVSCMQNCAYCTDAVSWDQCSSQYYWHISECISICPDQYYEVETDSTRECGQCDPTCLTCDEAGVNKWTSCIDSNAVLPASPGTCQCNDGWYNNSSSGLSCQQCHQTCTTCTTNSDNTSCLSCPAASSLAGTSPNQCIWDDGWYRDGSSCSQCHPSCLTWNLASYQHCSSCPVNSDLGGIFSGECTCIDGWYWFSHTNACAQWYAFWQTCSAGSSANWTSCPANATLQGSGECACDSGWYLDTLSFTCLQCDAECLTCNQGSNTDCESCVANSTLTSGSCVCNDGWYRDGSNCRECDPSCYTCESDLADGCLSCPTNTELAGTSPSTCVSACGSQQYYDDDIGICRQCRIECQTCTSASICTSWIVHYYLNTNDWLVTCPGGMYGDSGTQNCEPCSTAGWAVCTASGCTQCSDQNASVVSSTGECACNTQWFNSDTSSGVTWDTCHETCETCVGALETDCTSCRDTSHTLSSNPGMWEFSWPAGQFLNATTGGCESCMTYCLVCSSYTVCDNCTSGWFAYNDSCWPNCPTTHYEDPSAGRCEVTPNWPTGQFANAGVCESCMTYCAVCSSQTSCNQCTAGWVIYDSTCWPSCPTGYYEDTSSGVCEQCMNNCDACSSSMTCSQCTQGYVLHNITCLDNWPTGTYENTSAGACEDCIANCDACSNQASCSACSSRYTFDGSQCVFISCPSGQYYDYHSNVCENCHVTCSLCTDEGMDNWEEWADINAVLIGSPTICLCDEGYFDKDTGDAMDCQECDSDWNSCEGDTDSDWLTCVEPDKQPDAYPVGNWSVTTCYYKCATWIGPYSSQCTSCSSTSHYLDSDTYGYWVSQSDWGGEDDTSQQCHGTCSTWNGPLENDCQSCVATNAIVDSQGYCVCSDGYFDIQSTGQCLDECHESWKTCDSSGSTGCLTCQDGYYNGDQGGGVRCDPCDEACSTCSGPTSSDCIYCAYNLQLIGGQCSCPDGQYFSQAAGAWQCVGCDGRCTTCDAGTQDDCLTWNTAQYEELVTQDGNSIGQCSCISGYYDKDNGDILDWGTCSHLCQTCSGSNTYCTSCTDSYATIDITGIWVCPDGFYGEVTGNLFRCIQCTLPCAHCSSDTVCLTCSDPQVTPNSTGTCSTWNDGYYNTGTVIDMNWVACTSPCANCIGSAHYCTSCISNHSLYTTSDGNKTCVSGWPAQYFDLGGVCMTCDSTCLECYGGSDRQCTACDSDRTLISQGSSGECVCSDGKWDDGGEWSDCHPSCGTCDDATETSWLSWADGYSYESNYGVPICITSICLDGTYLSNGSCSPCHGSCGTCSGGLATDCLTCATDYFQLPDSSSLICVAIWPDGYYRNTNDQTCSACDPAWSTCSAGDDSSCLVCANNFYLQPETSRTCKAACPSSYYPDTAGQTCEQCSGHWEDCDGPLKSNCTSCGTNQQLAEETCECLSGYYESASDTDLVWSACHSSCATCFGSGDLACYTCSIQSQNPVNGKWECIVPFVASSDDPTNWVCPANSIYVASTNSCDVTCDPGTYRSGFSCISCPSTCESCLSQNHCTGWPSGSYLDHTYSCVTCDEQCLTCSQYGWESCRGDLILVEGECSCTEPRAPNQAYDECKEPIDLNITVNDNNKIYLNFDGDLSGDLTEEDIILAFKTSTGNLESRNWSLVKINDNEYIIEPDAEEGFETGSSVEVELTNGWSDQNNVNLADAQQAISLNKQDSEEEQDEIKRQEESEETTESGSAGVMGGALVITVLTANLSALWKIINYLQVVMLFSFFNLNTTPELYGFLKSLLKDSRIPNAYDYIIPDDYDTVEMPDRFLANYKHPLILDIFGHILSIWIIVGIVLILSAILKGMQCGIAKKIGTKIQENFIYNGMIRMLMESCVYIFLASFLNMRYGVANETHSIINLTASVGFLMLIVGFCQASYNAILRNRESLADPSCKRFVELTKELRDDPLNFSVFATMFFMLRRALLWAIVVFISNPKFQISISAMTNTCYFAWLLATRPYSSTFVNIIEILGEMVIVTTNFTILLFLGANQYDTEIGFGIIFTCLFGILCYFILILRNLVKAIVNFCRKKPKVAPESTKAKNIDITHTEAHEDVGRFKNE